MRLNSYILNVFALKNKTKTKTDIALIARLSRLLSTGAGTDAPLTDFGRYVHLCINSEGTQLN